jgi:excinuclease ABC subunit B
MFKLESPYKPTGDQPEAIKALVEGVKAGAEAQVLLGVTGSGKTFTVANVIQELNRPTLIMSHNKTLAAQLYSEMKSFFPHNAVEYFVSYYDYYQPEAYIPSTDLYIEKDLSVNEEIDRLRLSAVAALLSGRKDVIIVSSVSCIYGLGSPQDFTQNVIELKRGTDIPMDTLLKQLVSAQYVRNDIELARGRFRVKGDTIDIALAYADYIVRIEFFGNEIDAILTIDPISGQVLEEFDQYNLSPATIFLTRRRMTTCRTMRLSMSFPLRLTLLQRTPIEFLRLTSQDAPTWWIVVAQSKAWRMYKVAMYNIQRCSLMV